MVKLIAGSRGSGKTKRLIEMVNDAAKVSKGNVVCIEKGDSLKFDIGYNIRLVDIQEYGVKGSEAYFGFISGLMAGNYDITEIFGDATFKILSDKKDEKDFEALADFVARLDALTARSSVTICLTVSCDVADIPERVKALVI